MKVRKSRFPYDRMIRYYDPDRINDAMSDSEGGRCIKPVIRIGVAA